MNVYPDQVAFVAPQIPLIIFKMTPFAMPIESKVTQPPILVDEVLELAHSYASNTDETKVYTYDGECESVVVTFSSDTKTQGVKRRVP